MKSYMVGKLVALVFLPLLVLSCDGMDYSGREKPMRVILPKDEVREGWYFAAGDQVVIEGTVNGDAYVAGGLVEVNGTINGDLLVAGGQVTVGGKISDDIRAAGGTLRFDGRVGKNITAAGGSIFVGKTAEVGGNILAAGRSVQVAGSVNRNIMVAAGDMSVSGGVKGNVTFAGDNLSVLEGAKIGGDLQARLRDTTHAEIAAGTVMGAVDLDVTKGRPHRRVLGFGPFHFWLKIVLALSLLATGLVLSLAFPRQLTAIGDNITRSPGKTVLWGLLGLIATPIASLILLVTIIGIPLALFLDVTYLWLVYLSQLSLGVVAGQRLFSAAGSGWWNMFWKFAVGLAIVQVLTFVPYLRFLVIAAGLILGFGAILMILKEEVEGVRKA